MSFLKTDGKYIVNEKGDKVYLRGVCIGNWLNWESFMMGYAGSESDTRTSLNLILGQERAKVFVSSYMDEYITEKDYAYLSSLGANVVRIAFNYRHFESDAAPGEYFDDCFYYLDRAVAWGKKYHIYTILDFHAVQGWQNNRWHCDNTHGASLVWKDKEYQRRATNLWRHIAYHYKDEPFVAGYDLMNEPEAPDMSCLSQLYTDMIAAIRSVDKNHIIFVEGNKRGEVFDGLDQLDGDNIGFSTHNYNSVTLRASHYPGYNFGKYTDKNTIKNLFLQRNQWVLERDVVSWVGEFSSVFDGAVEEPTNADKARLGAIADEIELFNRYDQHWTIWAYKDIRFCGLVVPKADCEYMKRIEKIISIKCKLGLDHFVNRGFGVIPNIARQLTGAVAEIVGTEMRDYQLPYGDIQKIVGEDSLGLTMAGFLAPLYASQFVDMKVEEIQKMMHEAFAFENCCQRSVLSNVLQHGFAKSE